MKVGLPAILWAGFVDGKCDLTLTDFSVEPPQHYGLLYATRKQARRFYKDVRRVKVKEIKI